MDALSARGHQRRRHPDRPADGRSGDTPPYDAMPRIEGRGRYGRAWPGPVDVFGHSFGAILLLRALGQPIGLAASPGAQA